MNELADAELATLLRENAAVYYDLLACDGDLYFHLLADPESAGGTRVAPGVEVAFVYVARTLLGRTARVCRENGIVFTADQFIMEYYAITRAKPKV